MLQVLGTVPLNLPGELCNQMKSIFFCKTRRNFLANLQFCQSKYYTKMFDFLSLNFLFFFTAILTPISRLLQVQIEP